MEGEVEVEVEGDMERTLCSADAGTCTRAEDDGETGVSGDLLQGGGGGGIG